jgi:hypothetical protein
MFEVNFRQAAFRPLVDEIRPISSMSASGCYRHLRVLAFSSVGKTSPHLGINPMLTFVLLPRELRLAVDQPGDDRKQKAHRDTAHQDADDALKGR